MNDYSFHMYDHLVEDVHKKKDPRKLHLQSRLAGMVNLCWAAVRATCWKGAPTPKQRTAGVILLWPMRSTGVVARSPHCSPQLGCFIFEYDILVGN